MEKNIFFHIRFGLAVYIVDAKYGIFMIFSALAISKKAIFDDISGRTLVLIFAPMPAEVSLSSYQYLYLIFIFISSYYQDYTKRIFG